MEELIKQAKEVPLHSKEYWKLRSQYIEKHIDPTYGKVERDNCKMLWDILRHRG